MKQPTGHWLIKARDAVSGAVAGGTGQVLRFVKVHESADKQVEASVIVVVEPNCTGRPSRRSDAGFFGHIGESAVAVVVIEDASTILSDVQIGKAVSIVVAHGYALAITTGGHASLLGYVRKGSIAIVSIQSIAQSRIRIEEITSPAVDQVNVHPTIVVVVEKSATCACGLWQILLRGFSRGVLPGDATRCWKNFLEGISSFG